MVTSTTASPDDSKLKAFKAALAEILAVIPEHIHFGNTDYYVQELKEIMEDSTVNNVVEKLNEAKNILFMVKSMFRLGGWGF